ncbi:MAG: H(+)/Cl(-) exchange transporter ClcA, partial [Bdellovibrionales bacterium]|nr:H(+)/Cl(-) exchange transporter ClcA [Bdellovibrionales bacterium]
FQVSVHFFFFFYATISSYARSLNPFSGVLLFGCLVVGAASLSAFITGRFAPEASGSGIPHVKGFLINLRVIRWYRLIPIKFFGGLLTSLAGFSLGREGPTIQIGAAVGKLCSDIFKLPRRNQSHLVACGAGAGLAAAFNAPLAGFIFVIEELRRELSPLTYGTALIAAVVADVVTRVLIGTTPSLALPSFPAPSVAALPAIAMLGVVAGILGVAFNHTLIRGLEISNFFTNVPRWKRAASIAAVVAAIGWFFPDAMGSGHTVVEALFYEQNRSLHYIALLFVLKFFLTVFCYCSKVPGGVFLPILVQGALLGVFVLGAIASLFPSLQSYQAALGVIGMAAFLSAVVHAPLTSVILIVEMTANYDLLFSLLVGCMVAYLVSETLGDRPLYDSLLHLNLRHHGSVRDRDSEPTVIDVVVEPGSPMDGKQLKDLSMPKGSLIMTLKKGGKESVPSADTVLRAGYEIAVVVDGKYIDSSLELKRLATSKPL